MGIVFIDLDGFKHVNDTHGHSTGDAVLVHAAEVLARIAGPPYSAYRLGGDEFVVLVPEAAMEDVAALADTVRAALTRQYPTTTALVTLTASVGWTHDASSDVATLLRQADANMYRIADIDRVVVPLGVLGAEADAPMADVSYPSALTAHGAEWTKRPLLVIRTA